MYNIEMNNKAIGNFFLLVGAVCALFQAFAIWHDLSHRYPYKMMSFPPADFYKSIGYIGLVAAPILTVLVGYFLKSINPLLSLLSFALCPLMFWCVFKLFFLIREAHGDLPVGSNYDGITADMVAHKFTLTILSGTAMGLGIGLLMGLLMWMAAKSDGDVSNTTHNAT